ncbi:MAG: hypothetical protein Q8L34_04780 [Candidatus Woesearchaeota archaeon]|nr:hypothetical protein [Candidatus Woesearchaeota archaeon]
MRPNLVLMLSFLIFLVGFFSSQVALTGQSVRTDSYSSLTNDQLTLFPDLTVEDCRIASLLSGYDARSNGLSTAEARGYDPENPFTKKTTYQLQHYDISLDLDQDGRNTARDAKECYDRVYERVAYATIEFRKRPATVADSCPELGAKKCINGFLAICSLDAFKDKSWVKVQRATKSQNCREGFLDREAAIETSIVTKPWTYRFSTEPWIDRLSQ